MSSGIIIDSSRVLRQIMSGILADCGYLAHQAATDDAGCALVREHQPEVIFLGQAVSPQGDLDHAAVHALRVALAQVKARAHIIVYSEIRCPETIRSILDSGVNEYVIKPFDYKIISGKLGVLENAQHLNPSAVFGDAFRF